MATIEGAVSDDGGVGIEDAWVTVRDAATETVVTETATDANGDYSVTVDPDTYDVRAEKIDYEAEEELEVTVGSGETKTVNLTLSELQPKVIGRFTDPGIGVLGEIAAGSGTPIALKGTVGDDGYGLYTPDVVRLGGTVESEADWRVVTGNKVTGHARNVVHGHSMNQVTDGAVGATIAGGGFDDGNLPRGNDVHDDYGTIGGGVINTAGDGESNDDPSTAPYATVGGGFANEASGGFATVPGGANNVASGKYSFAAGRKAEATHDGSFVWSDSGEFFTLASTGPDQFIVDAEGGTGIGTDRPVTTFHVKDSVAESGGDNLGRHVAAIENTSDSESPVPDVLGLELSNVTDPGQFHSYISFMDSTGTIGNIQGDGSGGVEFTGTTADFAEFFPKADPDREFADGEVVGLRDGEVVAIDDDTDPDVALVVSTAPLVTGNRPAGEGVEQAEHVKLSLVGQVPVRVSDPVESGDVLVASPDDGTAVPRSDSERKKAPVVGVALSAHEAVSGDTEAEDEVIALIGGPGLDAVPTTKGASHATAETPRGTLEAKDDRIDALEREVEDLEAENEQLRDRLTAVEDRLAALDPGEADLASADD